MKKPQEDRLLLVCAQLKIEEERFRQVVAKSDKIADDQGVLPSSFSSGFQRSKDQVKTNLESVRLLLEKLQGDNDGNRKRLRALKLFSKAKEQCRHMLESLEASRLLLDSIEHEIGRWSRDQEVAELMAEMRSFSKIHATAAATTQQKLSDLQKELGRATDKEEWETLPITGIQLDSQPPPPPHPQQHRETMALLHQYATAGLRCVYNTLCCNDVRQLHERLAVWGFGILYGPWALDSIPLVGVKPQAGARHHRISAWFVEITRDLFLILVHLEIIINLFNESHGDYDDVLNNIALTLQETARHLKAEEIRPEAIRSFRLISEDDPLATVSALVADHFMAIEDHVDRLFEMNPLVEAVRDKHCYYNSVPWLTKSVREPRPNRTDWEDIIEAQIKKVITLLQTPRMFILNTSLATSARFTVQQFEKEIAELGKLRGLLDQDVDDEHRLEPDASALIGTLELWILKMNRKVQRDAERTARPEIWSTVMAEEMLAEIREVLDKLAAFLQGLVQWDGQRRVRSSSPSMASDYASVSSYSSLRITATMPPEAILPSDSASASSRGIPITSRMPSSSKRTDHRADPPRMPSFARKGKARERGSGGEVHAELASGRFQPTRTTLLDKRHDRSRWQGRDSASIDSVDSDRGRTAEWDMLRARFQ